MRLLRAINTEQAHGRVGAGVFPSAAALSAGLRPGTERYEETMWGLVCRGALAADGYVPLEVAARVPFGWPPYRLAPAAVRLLATA